MTEPTSAAEVAAAAATHRVPTATVIDSTNGVRVVAHDYGGNGPPLVLCHATGFHGRYWDPIAYRLTNQFRVISIDLRGHGDSEIPDGLELAWVGMAHDVLSVIDHFELTDVRVGGHSMGGCSAVLAEQLRPGTIVAAWLFEPIIMPNDPALYSSRANPLVASARRRREVFDSREAAYERYGSRPPFDGAAPEALWAYVDYGFADLADGTVQLKCRGEIEAQVFEHSRTDTFESLTSVATSIVIAGGGDPEGPAKVAPLVAATLPNGRFDLYSHHSHFAPMEAPELIAEAIRAAVA